MRRLGRSDRERIWRLARKRQHRISRVYHQKRNPLLFHVVLEGALDLISNAEATRRQLGALDRLRPSRTAHRSVVFIDVRNVASIDPVSILYLVAEIDRIRACGYRIKGNYPRGSAALLTMHDAEFERYVGIPARIKVRRALPEKTLRIISGRASALLDPSAWLPLLDFLSQSQRLTEAEIETVYATLGECIENVRQHAFGNRDGRWYAVALRGRTGNLSRVVVLDLGVGIHQSIKRTVGDVLSRSAKQFAVQSLFRSAVQDVKPDEAVSAVYEFLAMVRALLNDDSSCLLWATTGKRTRTGTSERGTGLTGLRETVLSSGKGSLHVGAGTAMIAWNSGSKVPYRRSLSVLAGSFVCLDL